MVGHRERLQSASDAAPGTLSGRLVQLLPSPLQPQDRAHDCGSGELYLSVLFSAPVMVVVMVMLFNERLIS